MNQPTSKPESHELLLHSDEEQALPRYRRPFQLRSLTWIFHSLLLAINFLFFLRLQTSKNQPNINYIGPTINYEERIFDEGYGGYSISQSKNDSQKVFFAGRPTAAMDEAWAALYQEPQFIRLSPEEATELLNEESVPLSDGSGYLAALDVFHQLHCLDKVRKALHPEHYFHTETATKHNDHVAHCLNYIRQKLVCDADIFPVLSFQDEVYSGPNSERYGANFEVKRQCKSFKNVHDWAMARRIKQPEENWLLRYQNDQE